ncbi:hypothetical protein GGF46_004044 [Coemansia sp. RSA 552]|nr:hypothetical protein GGF46_004044 [Coemansia sp. RSA 552]
MLLSSYTVPLQYTKSVMAPTYEQAIRDILPWVGSQEQLQKHANVHYTGDVTIRNRVYRCYVCDGYVVYARGKKLKLYKITYSVANCMYVYGAPVIVRMAKTYDGYTLKVYCTEA